MKILVLIPARAGSKGVKRKNIRILAGQPLFMHSVQQALQLDCVSAVAVSSDDAEILALVQQQQALQQQNRSSTDIVPLNRPVDLAADDTPMDPVISHALGELTADQYYFTHVLLLQPTSPLRSIEDIQQAISVAQEQNADCVISVTEMCEHPYYAHIVDNDKRLLAVLPEQQPVYCRQQLPKVFQHNGAIYLFSVAAFWREQAIPRQFAHAYIMDATRSVDINNEQDFIQAEERLWQQSQLQVG